MRSTERPKRWSIRAYGLLVASFACITRGVLYLPPLATGKESLPLGIDSIASVVPSSIGGLDWQPIWLFGAAWLIVGICGVGEVLRARRGEILFLLMVGLFTCWTIGFLGATLFLGSKTAWAAGAFYAVVGLNCNLFRRLKPIAPATPQSIEARLRVSPADPDDPPGDEVWWLQHGEQGRPEWVRIHPDRIHPDVME